MITIISTRQFHVDLAYQKPVQTKQEKPTSYFGLFISDITSSLLEWIDMKTLIYDDGKKFLLDNVLLCSQNLAKIIFSC